MGVALSVGEYVALCKNLDPPFGDSAPAMTTEELWYRPTAFGIAEIDLLKLDCEGSEFTIVESLR